MGAWSHVTSGVAFTLRGVSPAFEHAFDYSRTQDVAQRVFLDRGEPPARMSEARHSVVLYGMAPHGCSRAR